MAVETDSERAIFFGLDDFGTQATLNIGGTQTQVNGIFENDFDEIDAGGAVPFAATTPTFHGRAVDLADAGEGDTLTIDGSAYVIRVVMDDGTGLAMLRLESTSLFEALLTANGNAFITPDGSEFRVWVS